MFKSLKEKLKKWKEKISHPEETPKEEKETKKKNLKTSKKPKKEIKKKPTANKEKSQKKGEKKIIEEEPQPEKKTKNKFSLFRKELTKEKFEEIFEELELILLQNNVAYEVVEKIKDSLKNQLVGENTKTNINEALENSIKEILIDSPDFIEKLKEKLKEKSPIVILFAGINGSGKTTTIAKVANLLQKNKFKICLAAADTFRAAAIQQLEEHAKKLKAPLIKKDYGSDPASVGFDAINYAKKNKIDIVLIDTAGRMQNRDSLMREMEKISRVNQPDIKFFIGESITGNDATEQAKAFNDTIGLDGIILSKADVDEKGGTAISVSHVTQKPIYFLGVGQEYKDLEKFSKEKIIKQLGLRE